ncbi:kinase-like protein [Panus rudis PR-1116 ss-1]|nr:kinase-like protein [Panus rudis PR-1116 ss-1]
MAPIRSQPSSSHSHTHPYLQGNYIHSQELPQQPVEINPYLHAPPSTPPMDEMADQSISQVAGAARAGPSNGDSESYSSQLTNLSQRLGRHHSRMQFGRPPRLQLNQLNCIRSLGHGAFGEVLVTEISDRAPAHPHTVSLRSAIFAMKVIKKAPLRRHENPKSGKTAGIHRDQLVDDKNVERETLAKLPWNPFVAGLVDCFTDERNLYQMTELGSLGSLHSLMKRQGPMDTTRCQFYFANLVLALEFIHSHGVVHCDLKPENIVIGGHGYLMLCDFGNSLSVDFEGSWKQVGTVHYIPPEAVTGMIPPEYRTAVDWWAAACILYEMATGAMAFPLDKTGKKGILARIQKGQFDWPENNNVDLNLRDMVNDMLRVDLSERIGMVRNPGKGKYHLNKDVRAHPFMAPVHWRHIAERTALAPDVPSYTVDMRDGWHTNPMPEQSKVPGLPVVRPPIERAYDDRSRRQTAELEELYESLIP